MPEEARSVLLGTAGLALAIALQGAHFAEELATAPLVGVAGALLLWRLGSATEGAEGRASDRARASYLG